MVTTTNEPPSELPADQNGDAHDTLLTFTCQAAHDEKPAQPPPEPAKVEEPSTQTLPVKQDSAMQSTKPPTTEASGPPTPSPQEVEKMKKMQSFLTRTLWTFIMIGGFIGTFAVHVYRVSTLHSNRAVALGTHVYDSSGYALSSFGLSGSDSIVFAQVSNARIKRDGTSE